MYIVSSLCGQKERRPGNADGRRAAGRRVTDPDELPAALAWAQDHAPAVLDVMVTQDAQSPDSTSGIAVVPPDQALTKWQLAEEQRALAAD